MKTVAESVAAAVLLVVLSPILLIVSVATLATMGRPVLFATVRAGKDGRPFTLVKFRSMRVGPGSDEERLTRVGRLLRRSSLDELPQLWNVLRGDMSFVGPRPLPMAYVPRYSPDQAVRLRVKPGLTGWAQVNGRNAQTWDERFELDRWYVEHRSLRLDLRILGRTMGTIITGRGVSAADHATMPEFLGNA